MFSYIIRNVHMFLILKLGACRAIAVLACLAIFGSAADACYGSSSASNAWLTARSLRKQPRIRHTRKLELCFDWIHYMPLTSVAHPASPWHRRWHYHRSDSGGSGRTYPHPLSHLPGDHSRVSNASWWKMLRVYISKLYLLGMWQADTRSVCWLQTDDFVLALLISGRYRDLPTKKIVIAQYYGPLFFSHISSIAVRSISTFMLAASPMITYVVFLSLDDAAQSLAEKLLFSFSDDAVSILGFCA